MLLLFTLVDTYGSGTGQTYYYLTVENGKYTVAYIEYGDAGNNAEYESICRQLRLYSTDYIFDDEKLDLICIALDEHISKFPNKYSKMCFAFDFDNYKAIPLTWVKFLGA